MGNLVLHSADEPDNRTAPTSNAELPTEIDNYAALVLKARPNHEHETAAHHIPIRNFIPTFSAEFILLQVIFYSIFYPYSIFAFCSTFCLVFSLNMSTEK